MTYKFSKNSLEKLKDVKPILFDLCQTALSISPIDFAIVQGVRTQAYQNELYEQGRTRPGKIVTWTRDSKHIGGRAIDFAAYVDGTITWDEQYYLPIVNAFKRAAELMNVQIECGADWPPKKRDYGHIELL